jgi:integrase
MCKAVAKRAELSEDEFWLHKFRATFATRALRSGVDLRTVQMWIGHTDLESTMFRWRRPRQRPSIRTETMVFTILGALADPEQHLQHHVIVKSRVAQRFLK